MKVLIILILIVFLWFGWSYFSSNVHEPAFIVIEQKKQYQIREYKSYIVAKVWIEGDYKSAMNSGFRILAGYIFGDNKSKTAIPMTAPVIEQAKGQIIAMTAPVMETEIDLNARWVSFVMPANYTLENLPIPNDKRILFEEIKTHKVAVLRFSWWATEKRIKEKKETLLKLLLNDGIEPKSTPACARFNPPWNIPFLNRNGIWVDI